MDFTQSQVDLVDDSKTTSQSFLYKKKADAVDNSSTCAKITQEDLLRMFEHSQEVLQNYLGLREAVIDSRRKGEICWCDPRDAQMKERLTVTGWKPRVVFKLPPEQQDSSETGGVEYAIKQVALDKEGPGEAGEDNADAANGQEAGDGGDDGVKVESDNRSFICGLGGCKQAFTSLAGYESHYHTCHNYVCSTCRSSFVSAFLLDIHLEENHDSYFQVLSSRTDMFRCLVESCSLKFRTPDLRKDHLIKVHKLPANFMFHKPIKTKSKKIKATVRPQSATSNTESNSMDTTHEPPSSNMECETGDHSLPTVAGKTKNHRRNQKVPLGVCFGRGAHKTFSNHPPTGRGRHWHQVGSADMDTAVDIENVDFTDLVDSLECS
ncbi:unnamed protein product [Candidula unifasciata]|uniref:C2H2-type domain-containing protein n=1 Tax=Candidula unifasciata TaxID=100452 RepID=A0A8S3Z4I8_9EUPU|nr:unnamed protein product [Candidula unifasciata]